MNFLSSSNLSKNVPSLVGPAPVLPRRVDGALEWWARLPWRLRLVISGFLVCVGVLFVSAISSAGTLQLSDTVMVWVAKEDIAPGESPRGLFEKSRMLKNNYQKDYIEARPSVAPIVPIPKGTVVTKAHFDPASTVPKVPKGFVAVMVSAADDEWFNAGAKGSLWQISEDLPVMLEKEVLVVSVKDSRVMVAISEDRAAEILPLSAANQLSLTPI